MACTPSQAPAAEINLTSAVERLSRRALVLREAGLEFNQAELVAEIRKSATGGEFGRKGRRRKAADVSHVSDTAGAVQDLLLSIDRAFYAAFKPVKPRRSLRLLTLLPLILALQRD